MKFKLRSKIKFKLGQAVIERDSGFVYFVYDVLPNGFIVVQDQYALYFSQRDPNEFDLYNPRKDV